TAAGAERGRREAAGEALVLGLRLARGAPVALGLRARRILRSKRGSHVYKESYEDRQAARGPRRLEPFLHPPKRLTPIPGREAAMAREQVAGAIILGKLRERIISGLYLGYWRPGERLPSIREIAEAEHVDRKTAAAAYRRLQEEGLVRVRARSGVYLWAPLLPDPPGPLDRLHRQWLEHTY